MNNELASLEPVTVEHFERQQEFAEDLAALQTDFLEGEATPEQLQFVSEVESSANTEPEKFSTLLKQLSKMGESLSTIGNLIDDESVQSAWKRLSVATDEESILKAIEEIKATL